MPAYCGKKIHSNGDSSLHWGQHLQSSLGAKIKNKFQVISRRKMSFGRKNNNNRCQHLNTYWWRLVFCNSPHEFSWASFKSLSASRVTLHSKFKFPPLLLSVILCSWRIFRLHSCSQLKPLPDTQVLLWLQLKVSVSCVEKLLTFLQKKDLRPQTWWYLCISIITVEECVNALTLANMN